MNLTKSEPGFRGCDHALYTASLIMVGAAWAFDFIPIVSDFFGAALTVLDLGSSGLLLTILLRQPTGLTNKCSCRAVKIDETFDLYVNLESGFVGMCYAVKYLHNDLVKPAVLGCMPLLLVLVAVHAWCTQSFLWSADYDKAMKGLQCVRQARYVLRGCWLAPVARLFGCCADDVFLRDFERRAVG
jgi:hypothetical protein